MLKNYKFFLDFEVRDYECDMQGIVNNSVYLNYLEHARHKFLKTLGLDFFEFVKNGINFVVTRIEIDYKFPLKNGDKFYAGLNCKQISSLRLEFLQDIFSVEQKKIFVNAKIIVTAIGPTGKIIKDKNVFSKLKIN